MKRVLPIVLSFLSLFVVPRVVAQSNSSGACSVERIGLNVLDTAQGPNGCTATADVYFAARMLDGGQRFFTAHIWQRSNYPSITYTMGMPAPTAAQLGTVLRTIVIENTGTVEMPNWRLATSYPGSGVSVDITGLELTAYPTPPFPAGLAEEYSNFVFFRVRGVSVTAPGFCADLSLAVDVWGSNDADNSTVACGNADVSIFSCLPGDAPTFTADIICNNPRAYTLSVSNNGGCLPYLFNYSVIADTNGNGMVDDSDVRILGDADGDGYPDGYVVSLSGMDTVLAPATYTVAQNSTLFITAKAYTFSADGMGIDSTVYETLAVTNSCAVLPVRFSSFSASRSNQNKQLVSLTWETAVEQNNRGFHVQRKTDGEWTTIAFVPSLAERGNSDRSMRYTFGDQNLYSGITEYRLLQEDYDGRTAYSEIRGVRGAGQLAKVMVYPNPAQGGKATLMFGEGAGKRDVLVSDISGRIVQQFREVAGNTLDITGLVSGFYTIRVVDKQTSATHIEKLVVR